MDWFMRGKEEKWTGCSGMRGGRDRRMDALEMGFWISRTRRRVCLSVCVYGSKAKQKKIPCIYGQAAKSLIQIE